jgi:hypothetical protein
MDMRDYGRPGRLRERPPSWPRRPNDDGPDYHGWLREPEPFEDNALAELYPGSLVMDDLVVSQDDIATMRILARYTVIRVVLLSADGSLTGTNLRVERRIALEHLGLLPRHDWERRALERLAMLCREDPAPEIVDAITIAAEAAAKRSHIRGAFALYRSGYEMSLDRTWWAEAAQSARGIAQLALLEEARRSVRLWRRRAAVLDRRAIRAAERAVLEESSDGSGSGDGTGPESSAGDRSGPPSDGSPGDPGGRT